MFGHTPAVGIFVQKIIYMFSVDLIHKAGCFALMLYYNFGQGCGQDLIYNFHRIRSFMTNC